MFRILIYSGANIKLHLSVSQATRLGKLSQVEVDLEREKVSRLERHAKLPFSET